jgi:YD repeat-containing protein
VVSAVTYAYDLDGEQTFQTEATSPTTPAIVTAMTYDAAGRVVTDQVYAAGNASHPASSTSDTYDEDGNVIRSVDGAGVVTVSQYDGEGNLATQTVTGADGVEVGDKSFTYDLAGEQASETDVLSLANAATNTPFLARWTLDSYDAASRMVGSQVFQQNQPNDSQPTLLSTTSDSYDLAGRLTQATDGDGNVTSDTYDGAGRLVTQTIGGAESTTYAYNRDGEQTSITDGDGDVTAEFYDAAGRVIEETVSKGSTTASDIHYAYDDNGNLIQKTDDYGSQTVDAYAGANRLISETVYNTNVTPR